MESKPAISVILAAHNQEAYLPQVLASLRDQTVGVEALQFVLIDDASTDSTGAIFNAFRQEALHVHVERVEFHSVARSRNRALEVARAPYLIYVDGDDLLALDACEQWLRAASENRSDLVLAPLHRFSGKSFPAFAGNVVAQERSVEEIWQALLEHRQYMGHLIGSLFSRALFSSLRFPALTCYSDIFIVPDLLKQNPRIVWLDRPLYHYRKHTGNISGNLTDEKAQGMLKVFARLRDNVTNEKQLRLFQSFCIRQCRVMLDNTQDLGAETRDGIKKWIGTIPVLPFLLSPSTRLRRKRLLLQTRREVRSWG